LAVVPAIFLSLVLGPWRAQRRDQRDILANGQSAIGTIVAIDVIYRGKGGITYGVTVEFTPPDYPEPVRTQIRYAGSREVDKLGVYQQVPIHFREQMPTEAVIDEFVK
jgi:hypothetical protein